VDSLHWHTDRGTPWTLRCMRCTTERREVIGSTGVLLYRRYLYPDGYRMAWDDVPTREQLRLALMALQRQTQRRQRRDERLAAAK
jgi:hypothetical protein